MRPEQTPLTRPDVGPFPHLSGAVRWSVCDSDIMRPASSRARLRIIAERRAWSAEPGYGRLSRLPSVTH